MSEFLVEVCNVLEVNEHPNADRLDIATIKGWQVVVQKHLLKAGDPVVYFPPDTVMPEELADKLGIKQYLHPVKTDGVVSGYRVRAAKLRGVSSFGTIDHDVPEGFKPGDDVSKAYGVIKWEPEVKSHRQGKVGKPRPKSHFHRYKDIENLRNFPTAFKEGEEVVFTEKLHGQNGRWGYVTTAPIFEKNWIGRLKGKLYKAYSFFTKQPRFALMAGSHNLQRKVFEKDGSYNFYAIALRDENVVRMLKDLSEESRSVILFGEIIGDGVQDTAYGYKDGERGFRAFDMTIDGVYVDADAKYKTFADYNIPTVPILYQGPFSWDKVVEHTDGPTTICRPKDAGPFKGREGIVVTTLREPREYRGRKIYKSISADFLARKNPTDGH